jgi:hypothetical protein
MEKAYRSPYKAVWRNRRAMKTYFKQFVWSKKQLLSAIGRVLESEARREARHRHIAGIPDFELAMPDNPRLEQGELFRFIVLDQSHIGLYGQGCGDRQPFLVRLWTKLDRADERIAGFRNIRSFSPKQLDFQSHEREWIKDAHQRNQAQRERNGKSRRWPFGIAWREEADAALTLLDRLSLGDARAGEILHRMEESGGR